MAQLVRCYFRETGVTAADESFQNGTAFELALDVEFTDAEIALAADFTIMVKVKNNNTNVVTIPLPVAGTPAHNTATNVVAPRNQTFAYTIPAALASTGQFLDAHVALVIGASGQDTDICSTTCVIIP